MENRNLQNKLNELWSSKIIAITFNVLDNSIRFSLELLENSVQSKHVLEFKNVSSFFYVNNIEIERKKIIPPDSDDYLELTSINLIEGNTDIKTLSQEKWIEQYNSKANISIEIWSRLLLIESEKIELDSVLYEIISY